MTLYDRANPYAATLKSRHLLSRPGSSKETWHFVLDLEGSSLRYTPGDSLGVFPENTLSDVEKIVSWLGATGREVVGEKKEALFFFLKKKANIATPTKKLLDELSPYSREIAALCEAATLGQIDELKDFIEHHTVVEILDLVSPGVISIHNFCSKLTPLLPRLYSISSFQEHVGNEVHLTIAKVQYTKRDKVRYGVCTRFLCEEAVIGNTSVPVYIQPTRDFKLPENDEIPIIMVGPGTGVAPFRAFMQKRGYTPGEKTKNWLFFGDRNRATDFLYEEDWNDHIQRGSLRLDSAFSRDGDQKVYVQDKLYESRKEIWSWLQEGARVYICGDAKNMAKDVEACLHTIVQEEGNLDPVATKEYIKKLRQEKRFLKDVY